jgi:hypothetical protein
MNWKKIKKYINDDNLFNLKKSRKYNYYRIEKEKDKYKLNDLKYWAYFDLWKYFNFSKNEMLDIVNCLSFILYITNHWCQNDKKNF